MKKIKGKFWVICFFLLANSCTSDQTVVMIEGVKLSMQDLQLRSQINQVKTGTKTSLSVSLFQLVKAQLMGHLFQKLNPSAQLSPTQEAERIEQQTQLPEKLQQIKNACLNEEKYLQLFVYPQLAERQLYLYFQENDVEVQKEKAELAQNLLEKVRRGNSFESLAKQTEVSMQAYEVSLEKGIVDKNNTIAAKKHLQSFDYKLFVAQLMENILKDLKAGDIYTNVIVRPQSFWILKLNHQSDLRYQIEVLQVNKTPFDEWWLAKAKQQTIQVQNQQLWDKMCQKVNHKICF